MLNGAQSRLERMNLDWQNLQQRIQKRSDGTIVNPEQLDGLSPNAAGKSLLNPFR
jgi:hypothetical protein